MSDSHTAGKKWVLEGFCVGRDRLRMGGLVVLEVRDRAACGGATLRADGSIQLVTKTLRHEG
jgi:hypothetical protein